jgi:hypothetical protein
MLMMIPNKSLTIAILSLLLLLETIRGLTPLYSRPTTATTIALQASRRDFVENASVATMGAAIFLTGGGLVVGASSAAHAEDVDDLSMPTESEKAAQVRFSKCLFLVPKTIRRPVSLGISIPNPPTPFYSTLAEV